MAEVPGKSVDDSLKSYANDPRTADGVEGPGLPISANVAMLLTMRGVTLAEIGGAFFTGFHACNI